MRSVIFAVIAAALLLAGATTMGHCADCAEAELEELRLSLLARRADRLTARDPALGSAVFDHACRHYERAAALVDGFDDTEDVSSLLDRPDAELINATRRAEWQAITDAVLAGAPCEQAQLPRRVCDFGCEDLLSYRRAANLALLEARARRHEGRGHDAARLTLAVTAMGAACIDDGLLIHQVLGAAIVAVAVDAWPEDALQRADLAVLRALSEGLALLDERLPTKIDLDAELAYVATALGDVPDPGGWCSTGSWRYGFSTRWMCDDAVLALARAAERLRADRSRSWTERRLQLNREIAQVTAMANPVALAIAPNLEACEHQLRWNVAHLRLLRQAVALHASEQLTLTDPLGSGSLCVARTGGGYTISSAGDDARGQLRRRVHPHNQSTGARTSFTKR